MALSRTRRLLQGALLAGVAWAALGGLAARGWAQGWHQDERYGYKLQPPRGWKPIPLKASENWLIAKFLSDSKDRWNDEDGWTWEHEPELMVIAFVHEAIENAQRTREEALEKAREKAREEKAKEKADKKDGEDGKDGTDGKDGGGEDGSGGGDEGGGDDGASGGGGEGGADGGGDGGEDDPEPEILLSEPYADYEDYLDRTYSGGGFYVAEREEDEEHGLPVTKLEIKVEKLAYWGPKHITAWIYHAEGVDFAVQFEVLENAYPKHRSEFLSALRSFRGIPRTMGPLPTDLRSSAEGFISIHAMKKGTPEERRQLRIESETALHARAKETLPSGWQVRDHARFLVLYDTDAGFADDVIANADGLYAWAEENLGFLGPDEYVRRPILRLCETPEEMESLQRGGRGGDSWVANSGHEVVSCKDGWGSGWQIDWLNRALFDLWLRERDETIWFGLPLWVKHGLYEYVEGARASGRKLEFKNYQNEFRSFREVVQDKKNVPVRALVQMTNGEFYDRANSYDGYWSRQAQADMVVRFLLSPEARRSKQTKPLLFDYLRNLKDVVLALEQQDVGKETEEEPKTEEEEAELYKQKREAWQGSEREHQVLQQTFQRTFGGWSLKDWESFEKAFLKYAT